MAALFVFLVLVPVLRGQAVRRWSLLAGTAFSLSVLLSTPILGPLTRRWPRLGRVLHAILSPVGMALLFYSTVKLWRSTVLCRHPHRVVGLMTTSARRRAILGHDSLNCDGALTRRARFSGQRYHKNFRTL